MCVLENAFVHGFLYWSTVKDMAGITCHHFDLFSTRVDVYVDDVRVNIDSFMKI